MDERGDPVRLVRSGLLDGLVHLLQYLRSPCLLARKARVDRWQLAACLVELKEQGVEISTLRWAIINQMIAPAHETTAEDARERGVCTLGPGRHRIATPDLPEARAPAHGRQPW